MIKNICIGQSEIEIDSSIINLNLKRLLNQTYKLLPSREEKLDWESPLNTIIEEFAGMYRILDNNTLFSLLCKLEGLFYYKEEKDFNEFRRTIFECLNLISALKGEFE